MWLRLGSIGLLATLAIAAGPGNDKGLFVCPKGKFDFTFFSGIFFSPYRKHINYVKEIYAPFTDQQISDKIAEMLSSSDIKAEVKIIFQSVDNLHIACPKNLGDWYFTGDYPTAGGNRVVNRAFMNFYEGKDARAY